MSSSADLLLWEIWFLFSFVVIWRSLAISEIWSFSCFIWVLSWFNDRYLIRLSPNIISRNPSLHLGFSSRSLWVIILNFFRLTELVLKFSSVSLESAISLLPQLSPLWATNSSHYGWSCRTAVMVHQNSTRNGAVTLQHLGSPSTVLPTKPSSYERGINAAHRSRVMSYTHRQKGFWCLKRVNTDVLHSILLIGCSSSLGFFQIARKVLLHPNVNLLVWSYHIFTL